MRLPVATQIDRDLCTGCGLCVAVCPSRTLSLEDDKAVITGDYSMQCDHCAAICPEGAIKVNGIDRDALKLATVEYDDDWLAYGDYDMASLVRLMRSRRSCRMYSKKPVPRAVLEDLVKIATTAPSGTNCQYWTFTILPGRLAVERVGEATGQFFRRLNTMAKKSYLRFFSKVFMKDALGRYYREYYDSVKEGLREREATGGDRLFHGAPAAILVGMKPGASSPGEDALMASQNILLAAHAMGLGTCMIGFVVEAMKHDPSIGKVLGIPRKERIYAVIALGYPEENYVKQAGRKPVIPRYYEG